jgi:predicted site-specific integrase-resolvase
LRALSDPDPVAVTPVQRIKALPADLRELLRDDRDYVRGVLERLTSADTREDLDRYVRFLRRGSFTIE